MSEGCGGRVFPPLVATSLKDRQPPRHTAGASAMVCGRHWGASAGGEGKCLAAAAASTTHASLPLKLVTTNGCRGGGGWRGRLYPFPPPTWAHVPVQCGARPGALPPQSRRWPSSWGWPGSWTNPHTQAKRKTPPYRHVRRLFVSGAGLWRGHGGGIQLLCSAWAGSHAPDRVRG